MEYAINLRICLEMWALVTYPSLFRSVTVQAGTENTQDGKSFVSEMKSPGTVSYKDFDTNEMKEITDLTAYAKTLTLSEEVICTMINEGVLTPTIESLEQNGNVKGLLAELMGVAPEEVQNALVEPLVEERGILDPIALKVTNEKLTACIDGLIGQLEYDFLKGGSVQHIAEKLVGNLLEGKVDDEHTVFDVVETVYQLHLAGNENREQWLTDAILKTREGEMLPKIIKQSVTDLKEILVQELGKIECINCN